MAKLDCDYLCMILLRQRFNVVLMSFLHAECQIETQSEALGVHYPYLDHCLESGALHMRKEGAGAPGWVVLAPCFVSAAAR
jgi:hypothetical protein